MYTALGENEIPLHFLFIFFIRLKPDDNREPRPSALSMRKIYKKVEREKKVVTHRVCGFSSMIFPFFSERKGRREVEIIKPYL
jgi:hypothetical protein